ncbi:MAG: hypothetical protein EOM85_03650 [Candidatus Moranbacteria bacterium]|nr:hypothetical protein [Candidatus Moranbacteria bacterium]
MESFDCIKKQRIETPKKIEKFFIEYEELCRKYGISLSHEDCCGSFIVEEFSTDNISWVKDACIKVDNVNGVIE